ncbi:SpoIIE family protein phosphatase [Streptomyces antibioticus]|uniref:SpoIIE family protein phosphatase n=1 Tax=Streptomyces antibioticus TaxID=1890 RepID=UPI003D70B7A2
MGLPEVPGTGDIAGHGLVAATAMSRLHGTLRGIIFDRAAGQRPGESLGRLDTVAQGLEIAPLVTAVHVVLRRKPSDTGPHPGRTAAADGRADLGGVRCCPAPAIRIPC